MQLSRSCLLPANSREENRGGALLREPPRRGVSESSDTIERVLQPFQVTNHFFYFLLFFLYLRSVTRSIFLFQLSLECKVKFYFFCNLSFAFFRFFLMSYHVPFFSSFHRTLCTLCFRSCNGVPALAVLTKTVSLPLVWHINLRRAGVYPFALMCLS